MNSFDNKFKDIDESRLPSGLTMAFAQNPTALLRFTSLTVDAQDRVIERAKNVHTRAEMKALVSAIENGHGLLF